RDEVEGVVDTDEEQRGDYHRPGCRDGAGEGTALAPCDEEGHQPEHQVWLGDPEGEGDGHTRPSRPSSAPGGVGEGEAEGGDPIPLCLKEDLARPGAGEREHADGEAGQAWGRSRP